MAAPVDFRSWFASSFLWHESSSQRGLALAKIGEDRFHVEAVFCGKLFPRPMDIRDDRVFPHDAMLP